MTRQVATATYQKTEVLSSSPGRLVPLLYERLLVNLKKGGMSIRKGDIDGKYESLTLAQEIIAELLSSLDFDVGGEIAEQLSGLYVFWSTEISNASLRLEADRLDRISEMVASLHESWEQAARITDAGGASPPESAAS